MNGNYRTIIDVHAKKKNKEVKKFKQYTQQILQHHF